MNNFTTHSFSKYYKKEDMEDKYVSVYDDKPVRKLEHEGEWYFAIVDVISVLTETKNANSYWHVLKKREPQLLTICKQLKIHASDGKKYKTDCANTEGVFRIIMSVPSPKAEPLKMWLAEQGKRAIDEAENPDLGFERLTELYKAKGYSDEWIEKRLKVISVRKELTDEWQKRGVKQGQEYSILTATISKGTFGLTPTEHKEIKGLEKENLRDHMTPLELIFTALGEEVTRQMAINDNAQGFEENHDAAIRGGKSAGGARKKVEKDIGKKVVSPTNYLNHLNEKNE